MKILIVLVNYFTEDHILSYLNRLKNFLDSKKIPR